MYSEFLTVSKQTGIPIKKLLDMFWYLLKNEDIDNNELVQKLGVSRNALNQAKKDLSIYLKPSSKKTVLKESVIEKLSGLYNNNYLVEESLLSLLVERDIFKSSVEILSRYQDKRPFPKRNYDQFTATIETVAKRAALLDFLGDTKKKRILFLGDDDFTSVVIANMGSAENIVVIDIDERILNNIGDISKELNLEIKKIKFDLKKPIFDELRNRFDIVFTDPPYTPEGIQLFISRAIEALDRENQAARLYICYGNSDRAKERFLPIQKILVDSGLMIRWVFDRFNRYEGAESVGSSSSLYIAEVTPRTKPLIRGNYDGPIYTID